jgi:hypothetical protein
MHRRSISIPGPIPGAIPGSIPGPIPGSIPGPIPGPIPGATPSAIPGPIPDAIPGSISRSVPGSASPPAAYGFAERVPRWITAVVVAAAISAGCGVEPPYPPPPISTVPTSPAGSFAVTSAIEFGAPPAAAAVITALTAASDGPDDPARFVLDRMIASLPDGPVRTAAQGAAPYLAAYLEDRLDDLAPALAPGLAAIAGGLGRIAGRFDTRETLQIDATGRAVRTITGVSFTPGATAIAVDFADAGLTDIAIELGAALDGGRITLGEHGHALPWGKLLQLGLDRAVLVGVVPGARDLGQALAQLIDCDRLGGAIAVALAGSPAPYRAACRAGVIAIAAEIETQIAAIDEAPLAIEFAGVAEGIDLNGDGTMDELRTGRWSGTLSVAGSRAPITAASFTGKKTP